MYRAEAVADRLRGVRRDPAAVFGGIHGRASWGGASVSGPGSDDDATAAVRAALPALLAELGVRSLLDAPCGDGRWMARLDYPLERYTGVDVVPELVAAVAAELGDDHRAYVVGDVIRDDLPRADVVLCRDCLVHLPFADGVAALANIRRSGATWLLATTFPGARNADIRMGRWRPIDLAVAPYGLGAPLRLLSEDERDPRYAHKALGLWRLDGA